jgi:AraC family transcriptional regulator of adaptative response / DNA-3-methyladenine glycosylase II
LVSIPLRLAVRYPFDADYVFGFLANHAVPGVEEYRPGVDGRPVYRRSLLLPNGWGVAELEPPSERAAADFSEAGRGWLDCRLHLSDLRDLAPAVQRLRDLGDLDADPLLIAERLGADPLLAPLAAARPGIRSLGQVEPAEEAVRAVVGQQIAVPAARTVLGRLAARYGTPLPRPFGGLTTHFPTVAQLAAAEPEHLPMPATRQRTLLALTGALAEGRLQLERGGDREEAEQRLLELPGIGPWTTGCVRMRGLADPDVFLGGDMVVRKALSAAGHPGDARTSTAAAEAWRPWRSYATNLLWAQAAHAAPGTAPATATPTAKRRKPQNHEQEQQA